MDALPKHHRRLLLEHRAAGKLAIVAPKIATCKVCQYLAAY